jgi:hypothetical protein
MKLHASAIEKLISLFNTYGGSPDEVKLKRFIQDLDFTPYEQKTTVDQQMILVLTQDYVKALNSNKR